MAMLPTRILVVVCALTVALVGCGQDSPDGTPETGSQTTSTGSATTGTDSPDDDDGDNGNSDPDGKNGKGNDEGELSWVPIGPAGPDIPDDERWYTRLVNRECSEVGPGPDGSAEGLDLLYRGLGGACSALFNKRTGRWGDAQRDLTRALNQLANEDLECYNAAAVALARRLLKFPDRPPRVKITSTPGTVCPWGIDDLDPVQGSVKGGTRVTIYDDNGQGLQDVTEVFFGQIPAKIVDRDDPDDDRDNYRNLEVISPEASEPGQVRITVRSPGGSYTSPEDVVFTYVEDGGETPDSNGDDGDNGGETTPPDEDPTPTPSDTTGETG